MAAKDVQMFNKAFEIAGRKIGGGAPPLVIAELSGNHGGSLDQALALVSACKDAGAEAVKFQTYTPDTITLNSEAPAFRVDEDGLWAGRTLYDLYGEAHTPFEWHAALFEHARSLGLIAFSAPFDETAVDLLESLDAPAYKIASCELVDIGLIRRVAETGKPVFVSTGASNDAELDEAVAALQEAGAADLSILHCVSAYPTPVSMANLGSLAHLRRKYDVPIGFSDHTVGLAAPLAAVALGADVIEKHVCLSRAGGAVDSAFSIEPDELAILVRQCREVHDAVRGQKTMPLKIEEESLRFKRSLYIVRDLKKGEKLTSADVRSIRPTGGLHPRHLNEVLGRAVLADTPAGTPLTWEMLA